MTRQVMMVFFGEAHWQDRSAEHGAHGDFKPHESPLDHAAPTRGARRACRSSAARSSSRSTTPRTGSSTGSNRSSSSARRTSTAPGPTTTSTCCSWSRSSSPLAGIVAGWLVYQKRRVRGDRAGDPRQRLVLRPGRHRVHGRPGARGLRGDRVVRRQRRRRRGQRHRPRPCASRPACCARARTASSAPTPGSSASAPCWCSSGSSSREGSSDGRPAGFPILTALIVVPAVGAARDARRLEPPPRDGQARRSPRQRRHRRAEHLAARRLRDRRRRLPVREQAPVDRAVGDLVARRRRRHLALAGRAHRRALPPVDPRRRPAPRREARTSPGCCCSRPA